MVKRAAKLLPVAVVLLSIVGFAGMRIVRPLRKQPPPRTVTARKGDMVLKVTETGTIEPVNKVDVKSKVAGRLLSVLIQEGQYVKKGQLIATVDRTLIDPQIARVRAQLSQAQAHLKQAVTAYDLQLQQTRMAIAQARANVHTAEAHLAAATAGARPQELAQQQEAVDRARIALADSERAQRRKSALAKRGFIAQAEADSAQVAVDTVTSSLASARQQLALLEAGPRVEAINDARAQVEAARVQLASARANSLQNEVRRSDIAQARASVQQIKNDLDQLLVNLNDTRILAPASGIVLKKYKEPTEIVQSATTGFSDAQSIVATLGSELLVRVGINEVDISKARLKAPAVIHVDALPETTFTGVVTSIAPASTNAFTDAGAGAAAGSQSTISKFSIKVAFDHHDTRLRPGMNANVEILSQRHRGVVLAPLEAFPAGGKEGVATVLTAANKQEKRPVKLGLRSDTEVEILSGLAPGEKLVVPATGGSDRRKINISGPD